MEEDSNPIPLKLPAGTDHAYMNLILWKGQWYLLEQINPLRRVLRLDFSSKAPYKLKLLEILPQPKTTWTVTWRALYQF